MTWITFQALTPPDLRSLFDRASSRGRNLLQGVPLIERLTRVKLKPGAFDVSADAHVL